MWTCACAFWRLEIGAVVGSCPKVLLRRVFGRVRGRHYRISLKCTAYILHIYIYSLLLLFGVYGVFTLGLNMMAFFWGCFIINTRDNTQLRHL